MSRLSREQKRGRTFAGAAPEGGAGSGVVAPLEVRVLAGARDGVPDSGATVDGMPVAAGPGEPVQQAVLNHLHRLARAMGHPVLASVDDERIGYVVPIRVYVDGSSEFAGEPVRRGAAPAAAEHGGPAPAPADPAAYDDARQPTPGTTAPTFPLKAVHDPNTPLQAPVTPPPDDLEADTRVLRTVPRTTAPSPTDAPAPAPGREPAGSAAGGSASAPGAAEPAAGPWAAESVAAPGAAESVAGPGRAEPAAGPGPAEPLAGPGLAEPAASPGPAVPVPEAVPAPPGRPAPEAAPAPPTRTVATIAVPEHVAFITAMSGPAQALPGALSDGGAPVSSVPAVPGTVSPPTGTFGPPPVMPAAAPSAPAAPGVPEPPTWPAPAPSFAHTPEVAAPPTTDADPDSDLDAYSAPGRKPAPAPKAAAPLAAGQDDEAKEPPVREFDSVAEAVLGDAPDGSAAGPMARISAAVKQGRIEEAAGLAEQAVAESAAALGDEHPDVLRLRELTAYIAYLATDPLRSFRLSLDLARIRHRLGDPRGAYGNVQSAAAAWRAVRDPLEGLQLGRDLIAVWTELSAEGPAADDLEQLEKARSRMGRLAERARKATGEPPAAG